MRSEHQKKGGTDMNLSARIQRLRKEKAFPKRNWRSSWRFPQAVSKWESGVSQKFKEIVMDNPRLHFSSMPILVLLHVETVVLLSKGEIDSKKVAGGVLTGEYGYVRSRRVRPMGRLIAYVLEHTGLKVSSLYILTDKAQVRVGCGQNYNMSKNLNVK